MPKNAVFQLTPATSVLEVQVWLNVAAIREMRITKSETGDTYYLNIDGKIVPFDSLALAEAALHIWIDRVNAAV